MFKLNTPKTSKREAPESPDDLPATAKQTTRQIRRRNSLEDLSSVSKKKLLSKKSSNVSLTDNIVEALTSPDIINKIVPILSQKIGETLSEALNKAVESHLDSHIKPIIETLHKQQETIDNQKEVIKQQAQWIMNLNKTVVRNEQSVAEHNKEINFLHNKVEQLETRLENQEQYSRRTSLRFHNISIPVDYYGRTLHPVNTDDLILDVCNNKLKLGIKKEDICRSHVIGKPYNGKSQVIVRFLSYRIRERVYNAKRGLKGDRDKIFITENLTQYRNGLVKALAELKTSENITAYWTYDGRIYARRTEYSRNTLFAITMTFVTLFMDGLCMSLITLSQRRMVPMKT